MSVLVAIVNYRTADLVRGCLESLAPERALAGDVRAVVVDNDSGDGSATTLEAFIGAAGYSDWARVVRLPRNGGFAFGNNAAWRASLESGFRPRYVFWLNPDTLVRSGAILRLIEWMDAHPEAGIAGSSQEDGAGVEVPSAHRFPSLLGEFQRGARLGLADRWLKPVGPGAGEPRRVDWVSGAAIMARAEVVEQLGGMDEGFFLYFEEVDFCRRAARAGWHVWQVPGSRIVHLEGSATGIASAGRRRGRYWFDSRRRYLVKHLSVFGLLAADVLWLIGHVSLAARRLLGLCGHDQTNPRLFAWDLLWGDARALLTLRVPIFTSDGRAS
ncbi:MAG: glycosyltransferase family 2 protein [Phycisphaerae bacterium]|nr:glycosyltransferase family 2 protein [Phycisphaerae bacterium]